MRENKQNSQRIDQLLRVHESGESNWDLRKGFKALRALDYTEYICSSYSFNPRKSFEGKGFTIL